MSALQLPTLAWTGERMVPHASDAATELYHWQRYLFFRPWYEDAKVIDAASGEGYGTNYAATFAASAKGIDLSPEAVEHAGTRYPAAQFSVGDVCTADYSDADLIVSFETIEHVPDPKAFLAALGTCNGRIVISTPNRKTHSPGNRLEDQPLNPYHTVEWTPLEFADLIRDCFPGRQVRFLSQERRWPGLIREGLDDEAMYCIAVIGDGELPQWPKLGIAMPTHTNAAGATDAMAALSRYYPGEMVFAVTANGCSSLDLMKLRDFEKAVPHLVHVIESPENLGYGRGANLGFAWLAEQGGFDAYGVVNDDVYPGAGCVSEMARAFTELRAAGENVGIIGPVSDNIHGAQRVDIGSFQSLSEMHFRADQRLKSHNRSVTASVQVRGLFLLISPECLDSVGGFDPRFGIGNFEDDDHNLRTRLAGFSLWIADGAFLHHMGSTTFRTMDVDYEANIRRNAETMAAKWGLESIEQWVGLNSTPEGMDLFVPLTATLGDARPIRVNGEAVDLVHQASDLEFAAWIVNQLRNKPRSERKRVIELFDAA
ncbi:MAG: methyltransferase domain-containing protein [Fimbriimonadales bacterium]